MSEIIQPLKNDAERTDRRKILHTHTHMQSKSEVREVLVFSARLVEGLFYISRDLWPPVFVGRSAVLTGG